MLQFIKSHLEVIYIVLVIVGAILFVISIFSPLLSVNKFYIFTDTITLASIISDLFHENEWLLFFTILLFTIIIPVIKFIALLSYRLFARDPNRQKLLINYLEVISKWAMLDVFLVAIVITIIKLDIFTTGVTHYGLYLFASSILISMLSVQLRKQFNL